MPKISLAKEDGVYGDAELIELTKLLRIGLATVRKIASQRPVDREKLMDIANRSEVMAAELDEITGIGGLSDKLQ